MIGSATTFVALVGLMALAAKVAQFDINTLKVFTALTLSLAYFGFQHYYDELQALRAFHTQTCLMLALEESRSLVYDIMFSMNSNENKVTDAVDSMKHKREVHTVVMSYMYSAMRRHQTVTQKSITLTTVVQDLKKEVLENPKGLSYRALEDLVSEITGECSERIHWLVTHSPFQIGYANIIVPS